VQLKALLLDLDGTLVDTAPDMVATLNRILVIHDQPSVDIALAGKLVSNGAKALIEFGFGNALDPRNTLDLIQEFLADYAEHVCDHSAPYDGMLEVLSLCEKENMRWGIVTNKPLGLSRALLEGLGLLDRCSILLGGDSLPVKKPDPAPLLHCCMIMSLAASECMYVGDHERDIRAGNAAGMDTAAAMWGYIADDDDVNAWNARYLTQTPLGLHKLIEERLA
jgi:2-phosphoglycolate phosphatase